MLLVKAGVEFTPDWAGFIILQAAKKASKELGIDITITSGSDGVHSGPLDPHKFGQAYDFRSRDMKEETRKAFLAFMWKELGPKFYIFMEDPGTPNTHFHAQRLKNTTFTAKDYLVRP